jgi:hypothetical protein
MTINPRKFQTACGVSQAPTNELVRVVNEQTRRRPEAWHSVDALLAQLVQVDALRKLRRP